MSAGSIANIRRVVEESARCLARGHGVFFLVTPGNQDSRIVFLEHDNRLNYYWHGVGVYEAARPVIANTVPQKADYVYICRRRSGTNTQDAVQMDDQQFPKLSETVQIK